MPCLSLVTVVLYRAADGLYLVTDCPCPVTTMAEGTVIKTEEDINSMKNAVKWRMDRELVSES